MRKALLTKLLKGSDYSFVLNAYYEEDGEIVFREACKLGCEGIVSKRLGSIYRRGRSPLWVKVKNPKAPAVKREADEDWGAEKEQKRRPPKRPPHGVTIRNRSAALHRCPTDHTDRAY